MTKFTKGSHTTEAVRTIRCHISTSQVEPILKALGVPWSTSRGSGRRAQPCAELARVLDVGALVKRGVRRKVSLRPIRFIGRGRNAVVFRLADGSIIKLVAIGHQRLGRFNNVSHPGLFLNEVHMLRHARRATSLVPTNVPIYRSHRSYASSIGLIHMDFVSGRPLHLMDHYVPQIRARKFGAAVADIHRCNLVHGNLEMSNVIMSHRGVITLVDWARGQTFSWFKRRKLQRWFPIFCAYDVALGAKNLLRHFGSRVLPEFYAAYEQGSTRVHASEMTGIRVDPAAYADSCLDVMLSMLNRLREEYRQATKSDTAWTPQRHRLKF